MPEGSVPERTSEIRDVARVRGFCVYGKLADVSTAAHTIANTVESAFYIPGYGMQTAAATLAGNAFGEKNSDKLKRLARTIIPVECILMTLSGALLFLLAPAMMGIFSKDAEVISLGTTVRIHSGIVSVIRSVCLFTKVLRFQSDAREDFWNVAT